MRAIEVVATVTSDGRLTMDVPTDLEPGPHAAVVVIAAPLRSGHRVEKHGWPPEFFKKTAGALAADPLVRGEQGDYEVRDILL